MKTKTIYETIDGKHFENHDEAVEHELYLSKELLKKNFLYIHCTECPFVDACKQIRDSGICILISDSE